MSEPQIQFCRLVRGPYAGLLKWGAGFVLIHISPPGGIDRQTVYVGEMGRLKGLICASLGVFITTFRHGASICWG